MIISCLSEEQIHQENSVVAIKVEGNTLNDLKTEDFIVYKQMSFADMEIDDGGKYLEVDLLWPEFVQQMKIVNDNKAEILKVE